MALGVGEGSGEGDELTACGNKAFEVCSNVVPGQVIWSQRLQTIPLKYTKDKPE